MTIDPRDLARELLDAYTSGLAIATPPSSRDPGFDLQSAYAVEAEICRLRLAAGRTVAGRKVGFANKAMWRILKLDTLVWAHMYDDTVRQADDNRGELAIRRRCSPKIEPEIVFKLKQALEPGADAAAALDAVEWIALGFEINDCVFPDWQFKPVDFVAALGFHTALVYGEPVPVTSEWIAAFAEALPRFTLKLFRNGELVDEGAGKNALRSPALCLAELSSAIARQPGADPLAPGELVSTGTLTTPQAIAAGEEWLARVDGLDLPDLRLRLDPAI